jgi:NAD(P)-dependent dehydrogenase (short-subunit alcohol dehydrogenase family)
MEIQNKVALVTGGAQRVGRAIAGSLAARGAHLIIHYHRSEAEATAAAQELAGLGVKTHTAAANLSNPLEIETLFLQVEAVFGRVDILVNSAATFRRGDILTTSIEEWNYTLAVNLRAPFLCTQRAAHLMWARGEGGCIVNIGDALGAGVWEAYPDHSVSKAGLLSLTKVSAKALGRYGIRVNAVVPGPVAKPVSMPLGRWNEIGAQLPLGRAGDAGHVAQAVIALVENDFISGSVLTVDGGESLMNFEDVIG